MSNIRKNQEKVKFLTMLKLKKNVARAAVKRRKESIAISRRRNECDLNCGRNWEMSVRRLRDRKIRNGVEKEMEGEGKDFRSLHIKKRDMGSIMMR